MKFIENFNKQVIGERKNFRLTKKKNTIPLKNSNYRKKINDSMKLVPSLKYKMERSEHSEQKINLEEKEDSILKGNKISLHKFP